MLRRFSANLAFFDGKAELIKTITARFPHANPQAIVVKKGDTFIATNVCTSPVRGHACVYKASSREALPEAEQAHLKRLEENYGAKPVEYTAKEDTIAVKGPSPSGTGVDVLYVAHQDLSMRMEGSGTYVFYKGP